MSTPEGQRGPRLNSLRERSHHDLAAKIIIPEIVQDTAVSWCAIKDQQQIFRLGGRVSWSAVADAGVGLIAGGQSRVGEETLDAAKREDPQALLSLMPDLPNVPVGLRMGYGDAWRERSDMAWQLEGDTAYLFLAVAVLDATPPNLLLSFGFGGRATRPFSTFVHLGVAWHATQCECCYKFARPVPIPPRASIAVTAHVVGTTPTEVSLAFGGLFTRDVM